MRGDTEREKEVAENKPTARSDAAQPRSPRHPSLRHLLPRATTAMDTGISATNVRVPFKRFRTLAETPVYYRIFFAHMAPPEDTGNAGDFFVEIAATPEAVRQGAGVPPPTKNRMAPGSRKKIN